LIHNLAGSDDAMTRRLSLPALGHIDADKDITRLRLQKAFKAETDATKQARLQAVMGDLDKITF
jgi:hypothetical protein